MTTYYKVKPTSDQVRQPTEKYGFLIKNEIFTENQVKDWPASFKEKHFVKIQWSRKQTAYLFGARFQVGQNSL